MKNYIYTLFIFISFVSNAQINFEKSLKEVFAKAKTENKLVFIDYYNSECSVCQKVDPLLNTKEIGDFYNQHFVNYKINTNEETSESDRKFLEEKGLKIDGVPNFVFFDKNENFVHFSGVTDDVNYILQIGKDALDPDKRWRELPSRYKKGERALLFLYEYSSYAQLFDDKILVNKLANELYDVFPKENLAKVSSYRLLKNAVFTTDNGFFKYWINNLDQLKGFEKGYREGKEIEQIERIIANDLNNTDKKWTSKGLTEIRSYIVKANYSDNVDMLLWEKELSAFVNEGKIKEVNVLLDKVVSLNKEEKGTLEYVFSFVSKTIKNKKNTKFMQTKIKSVLSEYPNPKTQEEKDFVTKLNSFLK